MNISYIYSRLSSRTFVQFYRRSNLTFISPKQPHRLFADEAINTSPGIFLSPNCVRRLKEIDPCHGCLRVLVDSGGCSGFQYQFDFAKQPESDDRIIEQDGVKIFVDNISLDLLNGSTIDYQEELIRTGFRVTKNPQAEKGCSCGVSFALKLD